MARDSRSSPSLSCSVMADSAGIDDPERSVSPRSFFWDSSGGELCSHVLESDGPCSMFACWASECCSCLFFQKNSVLEHVWVVSPELVPFSVLLCVTEGTVCSFGWTKSLQEVERFYFGSVPVPFTERVSVGGVVSVHSSTLRFICPQSYTQDISWVLFQESDTRLDLDHPGTPSLSVVGQCLEGVYKLLQGGSFRDDDLGACMVRKALQVFLDAWKLVSCWCEEDFELLSMLMQAKEHGGAVGTARCGDKKSGHAAA